MRHAGCALRNAHRGMSSERGAIDSPGWIGRQGAARRGACAGGIRRGLACPIYTMRNVYSEACH
jgi:hypothetical protein